MKRLGTLLVEEQLITDEQLQEALVRQKTSGESLGEALVKLGFITEEPLYRFLAIQHGLEFSSLEDMDISQQLIKIVPVPVAWKYQTVPISQEDGTVTMATSQPDDLSLFYLPKELKLPSSFQVKIVVSSPSQVLTLLNRHFPKTTEKPGGDTQATRQAASASKSETAPDPNQISLLENVEQELLNPDDVSLEILEEAKEEEEEREGGENAGPVKKMCDYLIANAVRLRASDIHLNPYEKKLVMKYRIDGSLIEFPAPPVNAKRRIATRLKLMADLNIIERRKPQDGRIHITVDGKPVDLRVATLPTRWGENIVMRIVDQTTAVLDLDQLGFEPEQLDHFKKAISQPYGMVFVTGPTGSGKTSTLFAALNYVNTPLKNIVTVEDPVEFRLPHIIQIQIDTNAGRSFASVLRSFLRHDPNIMLIGEIRDPETADISVKASLTGHLVLSSLHTNDAASSVMRLVDLGIDPVYVGSSVLCIASQRLVRKICEKCKIEIQVPAEELRRAGLTPKDIAGLKFFKGQGCAVCHNSGYKGRLAVFEVLPITTALREIIFSKGTLVQLKATAKQAGFKTIRESALLKWRQGLTTLEEVLSETYE